MKIIKPGYEIIRPQMNGPEARDAIYQLIEIAGRTCYKSEDKITPESAAKFVKAIVRNHHEAMLEHASMTVKFIVDRGVSHELVRHRLFSFAQESTRYCDYSADKFGKEITVILPCWFKQNLSSETMNRIINDLVDKDDIDGYESWVNTPMEREFSHWVLAMIFAERCYYSMMAEGAIAQEARSVLPNSLKTEVVVTGNMREWRHFFRLRAAGETGAPHPQMSEVAVPLLKEVQKYMPELFGDIKAPEKGE